jgi:hypothetical protein
MRHRRSSGHLHSATRRWSAPTRLCQRRTRVRGRGGVREVRSAGVGRGGVAVFRGVACAAPAAGVHRFAAPSPATPWVGVRDTSRFRPPAPRPGRPTHGDDWLTLTVWNPDPRASRPLAVEREPIAVCLSPGGSLQVSDRASSAWLDVGSSASTNLRGMTERPRAEGGGPLGQTDAPVRGAGRASERVGSATKQSFTAAAPSMSSSMLCRNSKLGASQMQMARLTSSWVTLPRSTTSDGNSSSAPTAVSQASRSRIVWITPTCMAASNGSG